MQSLIGGAESIYDIIAIQEPWRNPYIDTTYCPRSCPYHLIWPVGGGRACFLVNKKIPLNLWSARTAPDYGTIEINLQGETLTVHNYYSPSPPTRRTLYWDSPILGLRQAVAKPGGHLVVGDFNLHHHLWGGDEIGSIDVGAKLLLDPIRENELDLLTERGMITWARQDSEATIDLTLCTPALSHRITTGQAPKDHGSDHKPIETVLFLNGKEPILPERRNRCWKKVDHRRLADEASNIVPPGELSTSDQIEEYTDYLIRTIQRIIDRTTPFARPSAKAQPWWTQEVRNAVENERAATRRCRRGGGTEAWRERKQTMKEKKATIEKAKQAYWRNAIHEASQKQEGAWRLAKWARTQSYRPPDPPGIPPLKYREGSAKATTIEQKAEVLAERFYPTPEADLSDIRDATFTNETFREFGTIDDSVNDEDVAAVLHSSKPWKRPGQDEIPNGILKAMGTPIFRAIARLTTACWKSGTYPAQFRKARTVVIPKQDKDSYDEPGAWRPIALLNTIGKVMEALAARRLSSFAETKHLLPDAQMGNRPGRSVDTALELLTEQIHTTWQAGGVATVLSLDISGAFDTVNHLRLLNELREKGVPPWLVRWIRAFLTDRTTTLVIDGTETAPIRLRGGVPQGSPLSPILFILYNSTLFSAAEARASGVTSLGFADDLNLLAYGKSTEANCRALEAAHERCLNWAGRYGMKFAPAKYTLIHFTRARTKYDVTAKIKLRSQEISPKKEVRILGIKLDGKLRWGAQKAKIRKKLETQMFALTRITASTWGPSLMHARNIYTAAIRSALAHGAPIWHDTDKTQKGDPRGLAANLRKTQNQCLRVVTGAFKAVSSRQLENEAYIPPLDIWLDGIKARFQERIENSAIGQQIRNACESIKRKLKKRRRRRNGPEPATPGQKRGEWAKSWKQNRSIKQAVSKHWQERWKSQQRDRLINATLRRRGRIKSEKPPDSRVLKLHKTLKKAESTMLIQLRTECIGLKGFLYRRRVPGVESALCECGNAPETPQHVLLWCSIRTETRRLLRGSEIGPLNFRQLIDDPRLAANTARWMIQTNRLRQFALADRLLYG